VVIGTLSSLKLADDAGMSALKVISIYAMQLLFEPEKRKVKARAYRVKLHFSLHCHLPLFLHRHFLLNGGLTFCSETVGVGKRRRRSCGLLNCSIGHSEVWPSMSCGGG
jgi:hypothetical protein